MSRTDNSRSGHAEALKVRGRDRALARKGNSPKMLPTLENSVRRFGDLRFFNKTDENYIGVAIGMPLVRSGSGGNDLGPGSSVQN
jgi:hypothetical protein